MAAPCTRINVTATMRAGAVTIDGVLMHRDAFAIVDPTDLWLPADQRGGNLTIPGRPGTIPLPRRATESTRSLPMLIDGRIDPAGDAYTDELAGLAATLDWLEENVTGPTYTGDGTRTLTLTDPDAGPDREGQVQVGAVTVGRKWRGLWLATLDIIIPAGRLAVAAP